MLNTNVSVGLRPIVGDHTIRFTTTSVGRPSRPSQVPAHRDVLASRWARGGPYEEVTAMLIANGDLSGNPEAYRGFEHNAFTRGAMWWVTEDMVELIEAAANTVPMETVLTEDMIPADQVAFCVFPRPLVMTDAADSTKTVQVDAIVWGPVTLCDPDDPDLAPYRGVTISFYKWDAAEGPGGFPLGFVPLGRSDWPVGFAISGFAIDVGRRMEGYASAAIEDRRLLAAIWLLASQPGITDVDDVHMDRHARRRAERAGGTTAPVRVVRLRQHHYDTHVPTGQHHRMTVRTIVTGHWRQQPYGPGRQYRRPTWIAPHMRGPDDAPLRIRPTVKVL